MPQQTDIAHIAMGGRKVPIRCFANDALFRTLKAGSLWERHIASFFGGKAIDARSTFFDIGANVGYYSVIAAQLVRSGKIVAVEPHPEIFAVLLENLKGAGPTVIPVNRAVGVAPGRVKIAFDESESGATHVASAGIDTEMTTIDLLSDEFGRPDVIKMDIEGLESDALRGGRKTFEEGDPIVVMEFAPQNTGRSQAGIAQTLAWIEGLGYQMYFFRGHQTSAYEPVTADILMQIHDYWLRKQTGGHMDIMFARPRRLAPPAAGAA